MLGLASFDDRYDMTFFFVPNTQKVVAGYLCGNNAPASIATACRLREYSRRILPGLQSNQAASRPRLPALWIPGARQNAAGSRHSIIATGGYDGIDNGSIEMAGTCLLNGACGVGSGGMEQQQQATLRRAGKLGNRPAVWRWFLAQS